ncbi:hypothetical protein [Mesoplasma seiffertii]|uniref:hypothetical protein n=1 Tax=Mesoplasma seiffertii TaxID=28224 RepID=UPI00047E1CA4|nr:hypothetical protein [Mesoplasma seiffertii]
MNKNLRTKYFSIEESGNTFNIKDYNNNLVQNYENYLDAVVDIQLLNEKMSQTQKLENEVNLKLKSVKVQANVHHENNVLDIDEEKYLDILEKTEILKQNLEKLGAEAEALNQKKLVKQQAAANQKVEKQTSVRVLKDFLEYENNVSQQDLETLKSEILSKVKETLNSINLAQLNEIVVKNKSLEKAFLVIQEQVTKNYAEMITFQNEIRSALQELTSDQKAFLSKDEFDKSQLLLNEFNTAQNDQRYIKIDQIELLFEKYLNLSKPKAASKNPKKATSTKSTSKKVGVKKPTTKKVVEKKTLSKPPTKKIAVPSQPLADEFDVEPIMNSDSKATESKDLLDYEKAFLELQKNGSLKSYIKNLIKK